MRKQKKVFFRYNQLNICFVLFKGKMNNYRIISDIGSGAYSTVHKAIDINTGHIVAIKKISDQNMNIKHIINRQVAILHECINHPNIIQLYKYFCLGNFTYLIFQYMPMDLISYYKSVQQSKRRNINDEEICYISYQLCNALSFLHKKGIMHRDIKPQNILIDPQSLTVKLIDFGFAKYNNVLTNNTNYMVTRWYRSLEIVLNLHYNQKVDIFAVGALILQLYLGHQIFRSSSNIDQLYWIINICGFPDNWKSAINEMNKLGIRIDELQGGKPTSDSTDNTNRNNFIELKQLTKNIRPLAADLLTKMLKTAPDQRISIHEACQHPYFSRFNIRKNLIHNQQQSNEIDNSIKMIHKENSAKVLPLTRTNRAFSTQQLQQLQSIMLTQRQSRGINYRVKTNYENYDESNKMNQSIYSSSNYRKNNESQNEISVSVKKQSEQSISGLLSCELLPNSRSSQKINSKIKRQNDNQHEMVHKSQYTTMDSNKNKNLQYHQQVSDNRKTSSDKNKQFFEANKNLKCQFNNLNGNKDPLSYRQIQQKYKHDQNINITNKNNYVRPTFRNGVRSLNPHGINVISLKKLKVHRQFDNVKSKQKINEYKEIQRPKQRENMIKLQPKRQKDKPMFMKVKDKINQGKLNERGSDQQIMVTTYTAGLQYQMMGKRKGLNKEHNNIALKTEDSQPARTQVSTKLANSASMNIKKLPQYKEYMFGSNKNY